MMFPTRPRLKVFASHDWGLDGANHRKVAQVVEELNRRGLDVWFDETHMRGNLLDSICSGIDSSDVVLIFVTRRYLSKVESGDDRDNVRREFMYASARPDRMIPVRFDAELPTVWSGPVALLLGSHLYVDLTVPSANQYDVLVRRIRHQTPRTLWRTGVQRAMLLPSLSRESSVASPTRSSRMSPLLRRSSSRRSEGNEEDSEVLVPSPVMSIKSATLHMRGRVSNALALMGESEKPDERLCDAVDRLMRSVTNSPEFHQVRRTLSLSERLDFVERELGVHASLMV